MVFKGFEVGLLFDTQDGKFQMPIWKLHILTSKGIHTESIQKIDSRTEISNISHTSHHIT